MMDKREYFMATQPIYIHNESEVVYKAIQGFTEVIHELDDITLPRGAWQIQVKIIELPFMIPEEELYPSIPTMKVEE